MKVKIFTIKDLGQGQVLESEINAWLGTLRSRVEVKDTTAALCTMSDGPGGEAGRADFIPPAPDSDTRDDSYDRVPFGSYGAPNGTRSRLQARPRGG